MATHNGRIEAGELNIRGYLDQAGRPVGEAPTPVTSQFLRRLCRRGITEDLEFSPEGEQISGNGHGLVRAFQPYAVTVLEYASEFQLYPTRREIFLYAPPNYTNPGLLALGLWTRWFKPGGNAVIDAFARQQYPQVGEAGFVDPQIGDDGYDDFWKFARTREHRHVGDPSDPVAFVCLDTSICTIGETLQDGLIRTV